MKPQLEYLYRTRPLVKVRGTSRAHGGMISHEETGVDQTSYGLVIDAGHNEGTSLREDAGYDEKC